MDNPLIIIPARMASTRLPGKMLADINGKPMILHMVDRARESGLGEPVVATDTHEIHDAVAEYGGRAVMTRADHLSGSDRVFEALELTDPDGAVGTIVNLQGDLPAIDPGVVPACLQALEETGSDIGTLAAEITKPAERTNPNVVKVVGTPVGSGLMRALYFTRATAPSGEGPHYHHIGIYAYRRSALEKFVSLSPGTLEKREKLEQLRALENGMSIGVRLVDTVPHGVDTPEDLEEAKRMLAEVT